MITLAIPTLTRFDLLADCVWSALAGTVKPDRMLIIDNSGGQCPPIPGAEVVPGRQPQSVAKAWNDAVQIAGSDLILANDDITFAPDTIALLLSEAAQNDRAGTVSAIAGQRFSLFWLRHAAWEAIGGFDEGFKAAYFEDNHAARLLALAGWKLAVAPSAVGHVGSATIRSYDHARAMQQHDDFAFNRRRYIRLWGGLPGEEVYTIPYDGRQR